MNGDAYRRNFVGSTAQCGCRWTKHPQFGDVLIECEIHKAATAAHVAKFERGRTKT